jgi:serine/threonine protein kinase/predicted Zn-dependent protease
VTAFSLPSLRTLAERLAEEMAERWRAGERPRVEDYLGRYPALADDAGAALELLAEEISLRNESGQGSDADELTARFPHWRQQVLTLLVFHRALSGPLGRPCFPTAGDSLGDFRLLAELGQGAHGRVFLAAQPSLADRPVVLKLGPRIGREHLSLSRIQHTHVVPLHSVHDFPERGLRGLCQPYFGGATLAGLLRLLRAIPAGRRTGLDLLRALREAQARNPVAMPVEGPACRYLGRASYPDVVCWIGARLADALHYAHERGLLHLDLKPSNVLLAADGQPMLLDFHLARSPLQAGARPLSGLGGTPHYMPPEQAAALVAVSAHRAVPEAVDGRADVYALGALLYGMLGGDVPIPADSVGGALRRRNPQVTPGLADLLTRSLATKTASRYATAADLGADLRRHLAGLPLRGVANRSLAERWRKWRRRRPYTLLLLGSLLVGTTAGSLATMRIVRQTRDAASALYEGDEHLQHRRYGEAIAAFRYGTALAEGLPFNHDLLHRLNDGARRAQRARVATDLHALCEQLRPLYGAEVLRRDQARAVEARCRELWQRREQITDPLGPEADEQLRADLLDLAILWMNVRLRLAEPGETEAAHQEALAILAESEQQFGPSCVVCVERRAHALAIGQDAVAEESARQAAALAPRGAWEHYALGRAYLQAGELARAAEALDRALALETHALWPQLARGVCAFRMGDCEQALATFSVCVALAPDSAACHFNRGRAYEELGRLDRARQDYERALELDPAHVAARELLAQLKPRR